MKAQMFIVTAVFMVIFIFTVQRALFTYSAIDLSEPFTRRDNYIVNNMVDSINETVISTADCADLEDNIFELKSFYTREAIQQGYFIDAAYDIECSNWLSTTDPPVNLSIYLRGAGRDSEVSLSLYHVLFIGGG